MGSGKSTAGLKLAQLLGRDFVDTDDAIAQTHNKSVDEIFKTEGEEQFRNYETTLLKKLANGENQIISTGGGIVLKDENLIYCRKMFVVYLQAAPEHILQNIQDDTSRPLLGGCEDKLARIKTLLESRREKYENFCDARFDVTNKTVDEIISGVVDIINANINERV